MDYPANVTEPLRDLARTAPEGVEVSCPPGTTEWVDRMADKIIADHAHHVALADNLSPNDLQTLDDILNR